MYVTMRMGYVVLQTLITMASVITMEHARVDMAGIMAADMDIVAVGTDDGFMPSGLITIVLDK